jgi:porin
MHLPNFGLLLIPFTCLSSAVADDDSPPAQTQPAAAEKPRDKSAQPPFFRLDYSGDFWHSPGLTGDWGGLRSKLADDGISFNVETLQYGQGNAHGGKSTNGAFRYGG